MRYPDLGPTLSFVPSPPSSSNLPTIPLGPLGLVLREQKLQEKLMLLGPAFWCQAPLISSTSGPVIGAPLPACQPGFCSSFLRITGHSISASPGTCSNFAIRTRDRSPDRQMTALRIALLCPLGNLLESGKAIALASAWEHSWVPAIESAPWGCMEHFHKMWCQPHLEESHSHLPKSNRLCTLLPDSLTLPML